VTSPTKRHIGELVAYFLRLGLLGFGGPVALVGQMEKELVGDRGWLTKEQMREAIAICQSMPGPLAIQVGIYVSYLRGGFWGAWAGGWAFIFPNFVIVVARNGEARGPCRAFTGLHDGTGRTDRPKRVVADHGRGQNRLCRRTLCSSGTEAAGERAPLQQ
jgi:chromate transporter